MEFNHISLFLSVNDLTQPFILVSGLSMEEQQNDLHEVLIKLKMISFCGAGSMRNSASQSQEHLMNWNNKFKIICCCLF
jgi:hypothetical protein